jgi:hypothetical protein
VVQHQRAQHHVEPRIGKRQRFGDRDLERHVDSGPGRLRSCACNHRGGRVDATDRAIGTNLAFGSNCQTPRSAPHVEDRFAR